MLQRWHVYSGALVISTIAFPVLAEEPLPSSSSSVSTAPAPSDAQVEAATPAVPQLPPPPPPRRLVAVAPANPASETERRSPLAMTSGMVLIGVGGLAISSVGFFAAGDCFEDCGGRDNVVRASLLGGAVALAVGIPLLIYGAKRVPSKSQAVVSSLPRWAGAPTLAGWQWKL
jgi:hypothetical protein